MDFRIADTFTDSLAKLTGDEQKAVKTTAFDLQLNPANPGMQLHRLTKSKDPRFWSVRVNRDVRLIVHRGDESLLLCFVGHHDDAYQWAERRKLETHPKTGAAQLVVVRELEEIVRIPVYVEEERPRPPLFDGVAREDLLSYGVPREWLEDVLAVTHEDALLALADRLPSEAAEALLNLAVGVRPVVAPPVPAGGDPFAHPDAMRRFRVMSNVEELSRALEFPWEKWTIFLHPEQRKVVERDFNGPARVAGSAGTGKTIVALHRAVHLARSHPDARVLLTTFSNMLANALRTKLHRLISNEPRLGERLEVHSMESLALRLYELHWGRPKIASREKIRELIQETAARAEDSKFTPQFLLTEWEQVVDAWQLDAWEAYRDVVRLGRKTRLPENRRLALWSIFERVRQGLKTVGLVTEAEIFSRLAAKIAADCRVPYDFAVIDEAQDISVAQLRLLAALGGDRPNGLFFAGDLGQRIFQQPFSWKALGVDVRGRSSTLRINYRTSHQIRMQADRLLDSEVADVDGNVEERNQTVSTFNGPPPESVVADSEEGEIEIVVSWIKARREERLQPHEMGVFVRSDAELDRARKAVEAAGLEYKVLDERVETASGCVSISTMHLAKGLEFRAVVVMACDDEVIPLQERIETVTDESDLEEVYNTERHLLYVACTRARDHLLVTSTGPASEFLDDLRGER
jgi:mRNA-degrading endonuclease RelE of RelBE toxin-antitoxin system